MDATAPEIERWGALLAAARLSGRTLPDPPRRLTLDEGYALADRAAPALGTPVGWKVGATSAGAMAFLGVAEPIRGRLFAERIWRDGARVALPGDRPPEAEPEVALRLARPLAPGADPRAAIGEAWLAAEIVRPSHDRPFELGPGFVVADNAAGLGALLGPALPPAALERPTEIRVRLTVEGGAETEGGADAVLGDPLRALAWLASSLGGLPAGALVLTGAIARAIPLPLGARLIIDGRARGAASAVF
jgi:2-keto-4-pentenoate hydratase